MNDLPAALEEAVTFDAQGLVCAVAQQHDSGEVLMVAWMNREALVETLASGRVCYWSRSRAKLWRKGESSGQTQRLVELRVDCDGRSEEHTSELQSLMRISYAVFCLKKKKKANIHTK